MITPSSTPLPEDTGMLQIGCRDRWQVYFRLRELGISCQCNSHQPLAVDVATPQSAIQLWSVLMQTSRSRLELAQWLRQCWDL